VWLAEDAGVPVGHVVLAISFSMEYGGLRGFVDDLYVRQSARGRGTGAALLAAVRDRARTREFRVLQVETGQPPQLARPLYARAGDVDSGHALLTLPLAEPVHAL
jgi:GNAT superfamily N-acetyltransferase